MILNEDTPNDLFVYASDETERRDIGAPSGHRTSHHEQKPRPDFGAFFSLLH